MEYSMVMKTSKILFLAITMIAVLSCDKEYLDFSPTEDQLQKTDFKGKPKNLPPNEEDCFYVWYEGTGSNYPRTKPSATVNFQGELWTVKLNTGTAYKHRAGTSEMWSSDDGKRWTLRKTNPFSGKKNASLVVHNNRLWVLGGVDGYNRYLIDIWSSANGIDWRLESFAPFYLGHRDGGKVTTFRNKLYVLTRWFSDREVRVYSSSDGKRWDLETLDAFGGIPNSNLRFFSPVVLDNALHIIGFNSASNEGKRIFRTINGRDWQDLPFDSRPITDNQFSDIDDFNLSAGGSVSQYKGLVWYIGGVEGSSTSNLNRIWYSSDMRLWTEYDPKAKFGSTVLDVSFPPLFGHTALPFDDGLLIFGGSTGRDIDLRRRDNEKVWTIYEDCIESAK